MNFFESWRSAMKSMNKPNPFSDERVAEYHGGGGVCPEQHYGKLTTGEFFYLRYRHGQASLVVGTNEDVVCWWEDDATGSAAVTVSQDDWGVFEDAEELNDTMTKLLDQLDSERANPNYAAELAEEKANMALKMEEFRKEFSQNAE